MSGSIAERIAALQKVHDYNQAAKDTDEQAVSPKAVSPKAVSPKAVSPKAVSPKAVSPRAVSPKAVSPKAVSPKAVSPNQQRGRPPPPLPARRQEPIRTASDFQVTSKRTLLPPPGKPTTNEPAPSERPVERRLVPPPPLTQRKQSGSQLPSLPPRNSSGSAGGVSPGKAQTNGEYGDKDEPPPALPQRPNQSPNQSRPSTTSTVRKSALTQGFNQRTTPTSQINSREILPPPVDLLRSKTDTSQPPTQQLRRLPPPPSLSPSPLPLSRDIAPDLSRLKLTKPKLNSTSTSSTSTTSTSTISDSSTIATDITDLSNTSCLFCRDFTKVDEHASKFPLGSLPTHDLSWLSNALTCPFSSPTDKARSIFVWLHHNINYDCDAFFGGTVAHATPASTLSSGLAVCAGYAGLFTALALPAGLESRIVGGHGKGYGYDMNINAPNFKVPAFESNHAWNVVKIDNDEWKLIDSCWGAGALMDMRYQRGLSPLWFTMTNEDFGEYHYPEDRISFFRADGKRPTFEQYILNTVDQSTPRGPRPDVFSKYGKDEGLDPKTFIPATKEISLHEERRKIGNNATVRFSFTKGCMHYDNIAKGFGEYHCYCFSGGPPEAPIIPLHTNGYAWWADIPVDRLCEVGSSVYIAAITTFDGKEARGLTREECLARLGKVGYSISPIAAWNVVE